MKNKTCLMVVLTLGLAFLLLIGYLFCMESKKVIDFLTKTEAVNANILVVEGWLAEPILEKVFEEFIRNKYDLIITTGLRSPDLDFFMLPRNGYLIFYALPEFKNYDDEKEHMIEIVAHSKMSGKYSSHFNFYINDSLVADFFASEKKEKFKTDWYGSLKDIDSIMVHFDNDFVDEYGDRNLYVKEIIFNKDIIIPYQFNSVYDIGLPDGKNRLENNFESQAEIARTNLITLGIDSASIVAVIGKRTIFNRTLASVLPVRKWTESADIKIEGINIITQGIHARRTLMTYRSVLGKSFEIGVLPLLESKGSDSRKLSLSYLITEVLSLLYYRIILLIYEFL